MAEQLKMYIFVNSDLNISAGYLAVQACHVTHLIIKELMINGNEIFQPSEEYIRFMKWDKNCTKVILKATGEQLLELLKLKEARGFYDSGKITSLTAIGLFPTTEIPDLANKCKLL
jgi:peptidyl-tRNA hydrolase